MKPTVTFPPLVKQCHEVIRKLEDAYDDLAQQYKDATNVDVAGYYAKAYRLTPMEAILFARLLRSRGSIVSTQALLGALETDCRSKNADAVFKVVICRMKAKISLYDFVVTNCRSVGYELTGGPENVLEVPSLPLPIRGTRTPITERAQKTLAFLHQAKRACTIDEITKGAGLHTYAGAYELMLSLEARGKVTRTKIKGAIGRKVIAWQLSNIA